MSKSHIFNFLKFFLVKFHVPNVRRINYKIKNYQQHLQEHQNQIFDNRICPPFQIICYKKNFAQIQLRSNLLSCRHQLQSHAVEIFIWGLSLDSDQSLYSLSLLKIKTLELEILTGRFSFPAQADPNRLIKSLGPARSASFDQKRQFSTGFNFTDDKINIKDLIDDSSKRFFKPNIKNRGALAKAPLNFENFF